jgi:hypothetical protein
MAGSRKKKRRSALRGDSHASNNSELSSETADGVSQTGELRVFISWSGPRSCALAHALRQWLPLVLHYVEPWVSETDIYAGKRWSEVVATELEASNFGVLCVTPQSMSAPWLIFEAGALAKPLEGFVVPLLLDVDLSDLTGPLAQFQAKKTDRAGVLGLLQSINGATLHRSPRND